MNELSVDHERHDSLLVAAHAAGDLSGADADRAAILVRDCAACAALAIDLKSLAIAVHELPAPARRRDFTLTPADAARLRRRGWARVWTVLRGDAFRLARPIGAGLASLGFAGLVFASTIGGVAPAGTASESAGSAGGALEEVVSPSNVTNRDDGSAPAGGFAAPADALDAQQQVVGERGGAPDPDVAGDVGGDAAAGETAAAASPNDALIVVSGSLFIVGVGLFGLRWTASKLPD